MPVCAVWFWPEVFSFAILRQVTFSGHGWCSFTDCGLTQQSHISLFQRTVKTLMHFLFLALREYRAILPLTYSTVSCMSLLICSPFTSSCVSAPGIQDSWSFLTAGFRLSSLEPPSSRTSLLLLSRNQTVAICKSRLNPFLLSNKTANFWLRYAFLGRGLTNHSDHMMSLSL